MSPHTRRLAEIQALLARGERGENIAPELETHLRELLESLAEMDADVLGHAPGHLDTARRAVERGRYGEAREAVRRAIGELGTPPD